MPRRLPACFYTGQGRFSRIVRGRRPIGADRFALSAITRVLSPDNVFWCVFWLLAMVKVVGSRCQSSQWATAAGVLPESYVRADLQLDTE